MNHPLMGTAMVASYHKSSQPSAKPLSPSKNSSLSAEQKADLEKMKAQYVADQHKASLEAQSGEKEADGTETKSGENRDLVSRST